MSTLKKNPESADQDKQRKENEGPGAFTQEFKEEGTASDLKHGGYQKPGQGGYQGSYDEGKFEHHPLAPDAAEEARNAPTDSDVKLIEDVRARLAEGGPFLDAHDLNVSVEGGRAVLTGSVAEAHVREDIEAAIAQSPGLTGVDNRIAVR
ncbi:hypothetical protein BRI6_2991 [plant metagenome]|uniref:BON domain-containing protein n=1 Tax=plant metagenome TaxID=1297885 RepID=A0A484V5K6_9ZZZZ